MKVRLILVACLVATLAVSGGAGASPEAQSAQLPVIRWGLFKNYQPVFVAQRLGYFRQAGVRVRFTGTFTSGPQIIQAAGTGDVDAGHSAISGIANAVASGVRVIGIADSQTEFANAPLMQWFVLADSPIRRGSDLRGKRIAVNSLSGSFYYTVLIYLRRSGLDKEDVRFVVIPHHNQEQALRTGQIDVAGLIDPYSIHMLQEGGVRRLFRAVDVIGSRQFSLVFFRRDFIQESPEAVRAFVRAYQRAILFIRDNPRRSSRIMGAAIGIAANLNGTHRYTVNAHVRMRHVEYWLALMRQEGELNDDGRVQPTDVATTRFTGRGVSTRRARTRSQ